MHPGDLARGCSDLEMTWLLCCVGAATGLNELKQRLRMEWAQLDYVIVATGTHQSRPAFIGVKDITQTFWSVFRT